MSEPSLRSQETTAQSLGGSRIRFGIPPTLHESSLNDATRNNNSRQHNATRHVRIHPKKLYGRSTDVTKLLQAYRRMTDQQEGQRPQVVVISGNDGVGKTTLAQTLNKTVTEDDGYLLRGKFDRLSSKGQPYSAFLAAFEMWTSLVLSRGVQVRNNMRNATHEAVPDYSRILIKMIPSLESIIGSEEESAARQVDKRMRFAFVFRKFVRAICSPQRPLVLLLDDVHYADQSSLDLLSTLIPEASSEGIMFVVTCKEAQPVSPLSNLLCQLEESSSVQMTRIKLLNLHDETVNDIVADILELPASQTKHLSDFIYQETMGNVNFVYEFLRSLQEKGLLRFDDTEMRWVVSEQGIYEEMESYNVDGLIVERMMQQSHSLLEVLKVASCLGSKLDKLMIDRVFGTCVSRHLFLGAERGFLVYDTHVEQYSFAHDTVQSAAYSLIPKDEKQFFHLSVGRKLLRNLRAGEFEKYCFVVMNQFRLGADLVVSQQEKLALVELCLPTAEKAVAASSFPTASLYLELGIFLLGESAWNVNYELSLALFNTAAEVNYCTGNFERVGTLNAAVFDHARCFRDKLRAYDSEVFTLGATEKMEEAMKVGLDVLRELGEPIPAYPSSRQVERETRRLKRITDGKSDESLLRLPPMKDPDKLAAVKMMSLLFHYAHLCRPQLAGALTLRQMRLTLDNGLSAMTCGVFSAYGMLLCSLVGDVHEGYRYGSLALTLIEKFKGLGLSWLPRCYAGQYACISPWTRPFRDSHEPLKQSVFIGLEFGDIEYSMLNANLYCFNLIEEGATLPFIQSEIQTFSDIMILQKQESALVLIGPFLRFLENLTGEKHDLVSASGQLRFDKVTTNALTVNANSMGSYSVNFNRTILAYFFGDYELALQLIECCHSLYQHPLAGFEKHAVAYWTSLCLLALAATTVGTRKKAKYISRSRRFTKMLEKWALDAPNNVLPGLSLVQAEYESVTGNSKQAYAKYLIAMSVATQEGMLNARGMISERTARHLLRLNDFANATPFLQRSYELYVEWGAKAKANHLKNEFRSIIEPS